MSLPVCYDPEHPLGALFARLDSAAGMAAVAEAARNLETHCAELRPVTIALLGSYTLQPFVPYLKMEAARSGYCVDVRLGDFNTAAQELIAPHDGSATDGADVVFVARLLEDVFRQLAHDGLSLSRQQADDGIARVVAECVAQLEAFRRHSSAPVVVHNFALTIHPLLGRYEPMAADSPTDVIRRLNRQLVEAVTAVPGCWILDFDRVCADVGYRNWRDDKWWHLARQPLSAGMLPALAIGYAGMLEAILGVPRKCLVLDLDNTLWGGVVGEDGLSEISLGTTAPGSLYVEFQHVLRQLQRRGVLLAINSKNNPADVDAVFDEHPDMVLGRDDFAAVRVNWDPKPVNMQSIATELNIGIDSLVFVDDSPAECALMRQQLPQVLTLQVACEGATTDPTKLIPVLLGRGIFDKMSFNEEDRHRSNLYRAQVERSKLRQQFGSVEDFLQSLEMCVEIDVADEFSLPRLGDLIRKTNQLNIAPRRYTAGELAEIAADPQVGLFSVRVVDRFGDNGIVGCLILRHQDERAYIDTLLLSCRVIGRKIETAMLVHAFRWARELGAQLVTADFLPTSRNAPAANLLSDHGFTEVSSRGDLTEWDCLPDAAGPVTGWQLTVEDWRFEWPTCLQHEEPVLA